MQITICPGLACAIWAAAELCFGFFARLQEFPTAAIQAFNPFDKMRLFHRVSDAPDFYFYPLLGLFGNRNVFFLSPVTGISFLQMHFLTATDQGAGASMQNFHDIAANGAFINLF